MASDAFDMLRTEIVECFANDSDTFIFSNSAAHEALKLLISQVHHHLSRIEQMFNLVLCFDFSNLMRRYPGRTTTLIPCACKAKQARGVRLHRRRAVPYRALASSSSVLINSPNLLPSRARMGRAAQGGIPARERSASHGRSIW